MPNIITNTGVHAGAESKWGEGSIADICIWWPILLNVHLTFMKARKGRSLVQREK